MWIFHIVWREISSKATSLSACSRWLIFQRISFHQPERKIFGWFMITALTTLDVSLEDLSAWYVISASEYILHDICTLVLTWNVNCLKTLVNVLHYTNYCFSIYCLVIVFYHQGFWWSRQCGMISLLSKHSSVESCDSVFKGFHTDRMYLKLCKKQNYINEINRSIFRINISFPSYTTHSNISYPDILSIKMS